ncbi:MAG: VCBS repeat-containing protein, partial [Candidatus Kapabacteria bacterium]|nr:VCBS repeat-containing protein [Candidatus Kapabacteria bacterium]
NSNKLQFAVFSFNNISKQYEVSYLPSNIGAFKSVDFGSTSIKVSDLNKDGKKDIIFAGEGDNYIAIQVFMNDGNDQFVPGQLISYTNDKMQFREFNLVDYDNDGDEDIILNPFLFGTLFRAGGTGTNKGTGVLINNLILNNNAGTFTPVNKSIKIDGIYPAYLKGFQINGKLKFIGIQGNENGTITVYDIKPGV